MYNFAVIDLGFDACEELDKLMSSVIESLYHISEKYKVDLQKLESHFNSILAYGHIKTNADMTRESIDHHMKLFFETITNRIKEVNNNETVNFLKDLNQSKMKKRVAMAYNPSTGSYAAPEKESSKITLRIVNELLLTFYELEKRIGFEAARTIESDIIVNLFAHLMSYVHEDDQPSCAKEISEKAIFCAEHNRAAKESLQHKVKH